MFTPPLEATFPLGGRHPINYIPRNGLASGVRITYSNIMPLGAQIRICDSNIGGQRHGGFPGSLNSNTAGAAFSEGVDLGGTTKKYGPSRTGAVYTPPMPAPKKNGPQFTPLKLRAPIYGPHKNPVALVSLSL